MEYVAIKRVDKSHKNKVLQEVSFALLLLSSLFIIFLCSSNGFPSSKSNWCFHAIFFTLFLCCTLSCKRKGEKALIIVLFLLRNVHLWVCSCLEISWTIFIYFFRFRFFACLFVKEPQRRYNMERGMVRITPQERQGDLWCHCIIRGRHV